MKVVGVFVRFRAPPQQHLFRKGTRLLHLYRNYCSLASNLGTNKVYKNTIYAEENCLLRSIPLHEEFDPLLHHGIFY
jgi:hypothetical protein